MHVVYNLVVTEDWTVKQTMGMHPLTLPQVVMQSPINFRKSVLFGQFWLIEPVQKADSLVPEAVKQ